MVRDISHMTTTSSEHDAMIWAARSETNADWTLMMFSR